MNVAEFGTSCLELSFTGNEEIEKTFLAFMGFSEDLSPARRTITRYV